MELSALSHSATTLLDAMETFGASKGADLRSPDGPGSPPPQEMTQAFASLLEGGDDQSALPPDSLQPLGAERGLDAPSDTVMPDVASGTAAPPSPPPLEHLGAMGQTTFVQPETQANPHLTVQTDRPLAKAPVPDTAADAGSIGRTAPGEELRGASARQQPDSPEAMFREIANLVARISGGELAPAELYRLQYLTGMLKVQATTGTQFSQQTSQGLESMLKQQG